MRSWSRLQRAWARLIVSAAGTARARRAWAWNEAGAGASGLPQQRGGHSSAGCCAMHAQPTQRRALRLLEDEIARLESETLPQLTAAPEPLARTGKPTRPTRACSLPSCGFSSSMRGVDACGASCRWGQAWSGAPPEPSGVPYSAYPAPGRWMVAGYRSRVVGTAVGAEQAGLGRIRRPLERPPRLGQCFPGTEDGPASGA